MSDQYFGRTIFWTAFVEHEATEYCVIEVSFILKYKK